MIVKGTDEDSRHCNKSLAKQGIMLLLIVITSLNLVVRAQAERCGSDGLGFRCEDNGECWEKVMLADMCEG